MEAMAANKKHIIIRLVWSQICLLLLSCTQVGAQGVDSIRVDSVGIAVDTTQVDSVTFIKTDNVDVIKAFEAKLSEATMLTINPRPLVTTPPLTRFSYDVTIIPYEIKYPDPVIKPVAMKPDPAKESDHTFIKLGYGNLKNPYARVRTTQLFSDIYLWNFSADYSRADNSSDIAFQKHQDIRFATDIATTLMETARIQVGVSGDFNNRYFYRDDINAALSEDERKRNLNRIGVTASVFNAYENATLLDYKIDISSSLLDINDIDQTESNSVLSVELTKQRKDNIRFTLSGDLDFNSAYEDSDLLFQVDPQVSFSSRKLLTTIGIDVINADGRTSFFPNVELSAAIQPRRLHAYIGSEQTYRRNNLHSLVSENNYLLSSNGLSTQINRNIYGGVKGNLGHVTYDARAGYRLIDDMAIYYTALTDSLGRFNAETVDADAIFVEGSLAYTLENGVSIGGDLNYNVYSNTSVDDLFHIPQLMVNAFSSVSLLENKLSLRSDLHFRDAVTVSEREGTSSLSEIIDLSVEAHFYPTQKIGVYLKGMNLLDKDNRFLQGYQRYPLQLQGGLIVKL